MKSQLIAIVAAVLVVGCGPSVDIHKAAIDGDIEAVKQAIADGADVNAKVDQFGSTSLHYAAVQGRKEITELLIAAGADVNAKDREIGGTPLHSAVGEGHKEVVELLIAKGADVNAKNDSGSTPLHKAAYGDYKEIAELLITAGADANAKGGRSGWTSLKIAIMMKNKETADLLRKHGGKTAKELEAERSLGELQNAHLQAQVHYRNYDLGINTLNSQMVDKDRAIDDIGRRLESAEEDRDHLINERNKLIAEKAELEKRFQDMLVGRQKVQQLQVKLKQSFLRKYGGKHGTIQGAAYGGDIEAVKEVLAAGADVNTKDRVGRTPLHSAAGEGHKEVVKLLIAEGADVNAKLDGDGGATPLHSAAGEGHKEIVELLVAEGADVNAQNGGGSTPLHEAAYGDYKEIAELLITAGADVNAGDKIITPLHYAAQYGDKEIVELLVAKGANVNAKNKRGLTPLHCAANKETAELLIAKGADVNAIDKYGETPLDAALEINDWHSSEIKVAKKETADHLRKHGGKTGEELKAEGK